MGLRNARARRVPQSRLGELEAELLEVNSNQDKLSRSHSELVELQLVLEKAGGFFEEAVQDVRSLQENLAGSAGARRRGGTQRPCARAMACARAAALAGI